MSEARLRGGRGGWLSRESAILQDTPKTKMINISFLQKRREEKDEKRGDEKREKRRHSRLEGYGISNHNERGRRGREASWEGAFLKAQERWWKP